ncbi:chorismate synthase [Halobacteriovorax sp. BALOs_7]|uniref:chorismate synthase n=1 Tax=Halobacteriovorax sp. BALOs_7 TaxID=2109558 RepID=UPI000EA1F63D|nr:chorismate synthase [Halobacteriovorax sp. BALOs_7]AYF45798.1 chorismate synthase [Halobacteriovorax sp. BALOs_7]
MRGSIFGKMFSMTTFGESHGPALGVVLDGVPSGLDFNLEDLQAMLDKRAPGRSKGVTARKEADKAEILSGVFENKTLGTPIAVIIRNTNQRSKDYDKLKDNYRPGHADRTYDLKYGIRDHRGGGRSSGRETVARVVAGYFASLVLPKVKVNAFISKLGPFECENIIKSFPQDLGTYNFGDPSKDQEIEKYLIDLKAKGDSVGGRISVNIENCPVGLGEPAFDKLKADLAKAVLSIGACVAFSFGAGVKMADMSGQEVSVDSANFGGIEGGISNGEMINLDLTFKPTSTVGANAKEGRHDPCILPRAVVVVESMVRVVLADHFLRQKAYEV